ncbi:MAG: DHH family phosphoesterase [Candidatus Omnitrophica bacterium]|nr:DHH family phosphoesterase [Candidatus Omnitrophota bacterium]
MASTLLRRNCCSTGASKRQCKPSGIARFRLAISRREPILIFGDSDVDGITATAILYEALRECGALVYAQISNRIEDGYGFPQVQANRQLSSEVGLMVWVDCGTNQSEEIRLLASKGIDVIVIDHHVPLQKSSAFFHAMVNPHWHEGPGRELCSAGLAFQLAAHLFGGDLEKLKGLLDLACLGTIADYAPMVNLNRIVIAQGISRVLESKRLGLRRLCEETKTRRADCETISRRLIPRLNASGRLGDASAVLRLLVASEPSLDASLKRVEEDHTATKAFYRQAVSEAYGQLHRLHFKDQFVMVVAGEGWHRGLMGPLASQIARRYQRPAIALALQDHQGIGSGRSIPIFNLLEALQLCEPWLLRFGGHSQACGLTLQRSQLKSFCERINEQARVQLQGKSLLAKPSIDASIRLLDLSPSWLEELERLAPFGPGNPRPSFLFSRVSVRISSARTARISEGQRQIVARGPFSGLTDGIYDVVAGCALRKNEPLLSVTEVRDVTEL